MIINTIGNELRVIRMNECQPGGNKHADIRQFNDKYIS